MPRSSPSDRLFCDVLGLVPAGSSSSSLPTSPLCIISRTADSCGSLKMEVKHRHMQSRLPIPLNAFLLLSKLLESMIKIGSMIWPSPLGAVRRSGNGGYSIVTLKVETS